MGGTVLAGLAVRFAPLGLSQSVVKYGGSMLWALMIYWVVSTLLRRWQVTLVAIIAGAAATAVEFFKLYQAPALNAFRLTVPGILLLGRVFSAWDIIAYWVAIGIGASIDLCITQGIADKAGANTRLS
jgi:predicted membrane protein